MKEAMIYEKLEGTDVRCHLCAHNCLIHNRDRGICAVRENRDGTLYSLVYGKLISLNIDPIEKKPLFHFLPESSSLSIATAGCNFKCQHCQNYEISQFPEKGAFSIPGSATTPEEVVEAALENNCKSISYTYTEPTIFFEFAFDCAKLAHENGIKNIFVSNGYTSAEAARIIAPYLDANNIDLKGSDMFYKNICGARLRPVQNTIKLMKELGVWVEVTTLIIPDHNDSDKDLDEIVNFISSVDTAIPWHVSRFYPTYLLKDKPPTTIESIRHAGDIGKKKGLKYIYEGNLPGRGSENTYCPSCNTLAVERYGFKVLQNTITNNACPSCKGAIEGVWK